MRVAVIDLGTNSTRLLVADVEEGALAEIARRLAITRLGEDVDAGRVLLPKAIARVEACVEEYVREARALGAERSLAVATSAVRDAANGETFLELLERRHGLPTRLVDGAEEARLTFRGVAAGRALARRTLVIDLGGGSTELIVGAGAEIGFRTSLDLGCVRLTERFFTHDPPASTEVAALRAHVRDVLVEALPPGLAVERAIGVAGTVTTLATLHLGLDEEDPALVDGHRLPARWIAREARLLAATPAAELARRPGLHPDRAPVIAAGALAVAVILELAELASLEVSESDILQGAALELGSDRER